MVQSTIIFSAEYFCQYSNQLKNICVNNYQTTLKHFWIFSSIVETFSSPCPPRLNLPVSSKIYVRETISPILMVLKLKFYQSSITETES